jgi:hypothetical protein
VIATDPVSNAGGVGINAVVRFGFSERVNALTVNSGTVQVFRNNDGAFIVPTGMVVAADGMSAVWSGPLQASTTYRVTWNGNGITDLAGNGINGGTIFFTTGQGADTSAPVVVGTAPGNGATGVAVNARVGVQFNEALEVVGLGQPVVVTGGGTTVSGSVSVSGDRTTVYFTPAGLLAASTVYTVTVSGVKDAVGNVAGAVVFSFTTGVSGVADTVRPSVVSMSPGNGASNIATTSPVVLTFNELIDGTTVNGNSVLIRNNNTGAVFTGTYVTNGAVVTFTPSSPWPGNTPVLVQVNVTGINLTDLAGNSSNSFGAVFTTGTQ